MIDYKQAIMNMKQGKNIPYKHETIANLITMANKLDEVRQIVTNYDGSIPSMIKQFGEIQKVLEQE